MADLASVLGDLAAEGDDLDRLVADLAEADWARQTPAATWTIAHQLAHLYWTDDVAMLSATDPAAFADVVTQAWQNPTGFVDDGAEAQVKAHPPAILLQRWRAGRTALVAALRDVEPGRKLDWFGPPMSVASMATARIMETWAHGHDVADALGVDRAPTPRLKHVAHIGVRARDFAFQVRNSAPPMQEFRVELTAPDGSLWSWGPSDADQRVTGPALDFCLLVTQRRHLDDLAVTATGPDAQHWLSIAQAFAGTPGAGREPGQFDRRANQ